ncbi:GntR family transcriptional regulator [Flavivirga sp. 57AJ16]|uniref:GntR family transcriptional regulator n=1 Tax=Flavivirga sp. 57AJ16 TaxID=3025307 RepID=UPI002366D125|nr:GntR family transcriptional regulator [Flavivirga sp. 57AJ16]MDD7884506.1 GntR family transcriptional regulator [Flavivirga sp. 57AJ16]
MELKVDHSNPIPLHIQVEQLLRNLIMLPEYENGAFLPKEIELSKKLGVSRNTVRQATNKLQLEGLIVRKKGVGTKVSKNEITTNLSEWHSFTQEMNLKGVPSLNLSIKVEWVFVNDRIANFLNVDKKTKILKLTRVKGRKSPLVYFESYFQPRIGLNGEEDFNRPLYDILEQDYNSIPSISKENIKVGFAGDYSQFLEIQDNDPILIRERFVSDPGDRPLEYNIGYYRGDRFTYSIEIRR